MILVDGMPAGEVSLADRGLNYGDGLFETMRMHAGGVPLLERHLARLEAGCQSLGIRGLEPGAVSADVGRVAAAGGEGIIKIIVTRGDGGRGYAPPPAARPRRIVGLHPLPPVPRQPVEIGICATPIGRSPALAGIKHLGRLEQVLGAAEVAAAGWFDGLMADESGRVAEATRHNLFIVRAGRLVTPALENFGVAGIVRGMVIESASKLGIELEEGTIELAGLGAAEEAFLTNAVSGLVPVGRLAGRPLARGPVTTQISAGLRAAGVTWLAG